MAPQQHPSVLGGKEGSLLAEIGQVDEAGIYFDNRLIRFERS